MSRICSDDDDDSGVFGKIEYSILSGDDASNKFTINRTTGIISTTINQLDTEKKHRYVLKFQVSDGTFSNMYDLRIEVSLTLSEEDF